MPALPIKIVIVTAFEPDGGSAPGEFRHWREREGLNQRIDFPTGYRPLQSDGKGVLGIITGVGAARAASSIMALGLDSRFDLTAAYFVICGIAGIDPAIGTLGSVIIPEYVVDGTFAHEIDAREIPADWPDGFVPIGKSLPYEKPRADRFNGDDGIVFRLNSSLVTWAYELTRNTPLLDSDQMAERRKQFEPAVTAHRAPSVLRGDELSSTTFWHGKLLSQRARRWVAYQTQELGQYAITGMEDTGILQSLTQLASAGRIDFARILILRSASNFDQQRAGIDAAESLAETRIATYSAYLPALENVYRVGKRVIEALLAGGPSRE